MLDRTRFRRLRARRRGASRLARVLAGVLALVPAACAREIADPAAGDVPIHFQVSNALIAPVTVSVDGTPYAILTSGKATSITVPGNAQWLTWTSAKPAGPDGAPIPDQIGEVKVSISGINGALEIANVIDDQTYITARVFNATNVQVAIGVTDGSNLYCAGVVPAGSADGVKGFVQIGYYRLLPSTEVRAYRDALRCTGPYLAWPSSQLTAFTAKSGLLTLLLESAP